MNTGDWIAYTGTPQNNWRPFYCYRWTGTQWVEIPMSESAPYMAALADITEGAPSGVFSSLLVGKIIAQEIVADLIGAKNITINSEGSIRSEVFNDTTGFELLASGLLKAIGIKANNGIYKDMKITGMFDAMVSLGGRSIPAPSGTLIDGDTAVPIAGVFIGVLILIAFGNGIFYFIGRKSGIFDYINLGNGKFILDFGDTTQGRAIAEFCIIMGSNSLGGRVVKTGTNGLGGVYIENRDTSNIAQNSRTIEILIC